MADHERSTDLSAEKQRQQRSFWRRVLRCPHGWDCSSCCWPWLGATNKDHYGRTRYKLGEGDYETYVHRVAWRMWYQRDFPPGTESCHTCDRHDCCNPAHIRPDTHQVNMDERARRSPVLVRRGTAVHSAKLTEANVHNIWYRHIIMRESQRIIAAAFGVTQVCIHHILIGKTWKHVAVPDFSDHVISDA